MARRMLYVRQGQAQRQPANKKLERHTMQTITHILSLPVDNSTLDFALVCAGIVAVRVGLSIVLHKLAK